MFGGLSLLSSSAIFLYSWIKYDQATNFMMTIKPQIITVDNNNISNLKDGDLIYVNDKAVTPTLKDKLLQIELKNCPGYIREPEMYQYVWHDNLWKYFTPTYWIFGEPKTWYNYCHLSLSEFKLFENRNPSFPFLKEKRFADEIQVGTFKVLNNELAKFLKLEEKVFLNEDDIKNVPLSSAKDETSDLEKKRKDNDWQQYSLENRLKLNRLGRLYIQLDKSTIDVGDLRVSYYSTGMDTSNATVIGRKNGNRIETYTKDNDSFFYVKFGNHSVNEAIEDASSEAWSTFVKWNIWSGILFSVGAGTLTYEYLSNKH